MRHAREIKVAVLVIICGFLVYFGLYFLKGVNIFSSVNQYIGLFENVSGLQEQSPVYVRGYKVGQVDDIVYDFTREQAFTVIISVDKHIVLPSASQMQLVDDGLLGGKAIEVVIPVGDYSDDLVYAQGDTLPTTIVPGLLASVQVGLLKKVDDAMQNIDSLVININSQIDNHTIKNSLDNVEQVSASLVASAHDINKVTKNQIPNLVSHADALLVDAKDVVLDVKNADLPATLARVDQTIDTVQTLLTSKEGTLGLLLYDKALYQHIDSTIVSVDSLVTDLKAQPKRYVHFSLFGGKDKKKKANKK